ncbi:MAG: CBS domain-containing protein [Pseudomonadota bacterium]
MRAPTNYAGPRRKVKKPKQFSQSLATKLSAQISDVRQILKSKGSRVVSVSGTDSVQSTINLLHKERIGAVLVLGEAGEIEGILSERDIIRRLADLGSSLVEGQVGDIMTREVKTCAPDEPLARVLQTMTEGRFRHLPVVEDDRLIGIITIGDVVKRRVEELEMETLGMKQVIVG